MTLNPSVVTAARIIAELVERLGGHVELDGAVLDRPAGGLAITIVDGTINLDTRSTSTINPTLRLDADGPGG